MEFRWEALTTRGVAGRVELRFVSTREAVEVAMLPYGAAGDDRYVVEVRRAREHGSGRHRRDGHAREWRTVRTVGTTDDYSTGLAMVVEALLDLEGH
jgi:hypothetical protein